MRDTIKLGVGIGQEKEIAKRAFRGRVGKEAGPIVHTKRPVLKIAKEEDNFKRAHHKSEMEAMALQAMSQSIVPLRSAAESIAIKFPRWATSRHQLKFVDSYLRNHVQEEYC